MKNKLIAFLALAVAALAGVCAVQWQHLRAANARALEAKAQAAAEAQGRQAEADEVKRLERERSRLGQNVDQFTRLVTSLRSSESSHASNLARLTQAAPTAGTARPTEVAGATEGGAAKGVGDMLTKMVKDPAMKEFLRTQQKTILQKMYGPLFKDLNLPAEQKNQLMAALLDHQMATIEQAGGLFKPEGGDTAAAAQSLQDKEKQFNEQVKAMLGDDKFTQFEEYKKTMGERLVLDQFKQQLADGQSPLQDEQTKSLLQIMKEERDKLPPVIAKQDSQNPANIAQQLTDENLDKQFQWQSDLNQRVAERAGQVLTPAQLKEFTDFQTQQANLQKASMKMAREMFGGGKAPAQP